MFNAAATSGAMGLSNCMRAPVIGCVNPKVLACSAWRRRQLRTGLGTVRAFGCNFAAVPLPVPPESAPPYLLGNGARVHDCICVCEHRRMISWSACGKWATRRKFKKEHRPNTYFNTHSSVQISAI